MENFKEVNALEVIVNKVLDENLFIHDSSDITKVIIENMKVEITPAGRVVKFKSSPYINATWNAGSTKQDEILKLFNSDEGDYLIKLKLINMAIEDKDHHIRGLFSNGLLKLILGMLNSGSESESLLGYKHPINTVLGKILQDNNELLNEASTHNTAFSIINQIHTDIVDWTSIKLDSVTGYTTCTIEHPDGVYSYVFPKDVLAKININYNLKDHSNFIKWFDLLYIHDSSNLIIELTKMLKSKFNIESIPVYDIDLNNYILSPELINMFPRDYICDGYATLKVYHGCNPDVFENLLDVGSILIKVDNSFDNLTEIVIDQDMKVRTVVKFNQEASMRNSRFRPMTPRFKED